MAAANWGLGPGAGSQRAAEKDLSLYTSALKALQDLADALPGFATHLKRGDDLAARQQAPAQSGGSIEQTGNGAEQVQLRLRERVGEGTFCVVYRAELLPKTPGETPAKAVAAKFELRKTDSTQLRNEFRMYKKFIDCPGIANIYCFGEIDFHKVLVMDLLGPSLESYFQDCGRQFSIRTVCTLAQQMISRVQAVHEHNLIYRDIKPENFLMGLPSTENANIVHLIDYGMAKSYRDSETKKHIPYGESQSLSGTARYMSINAHCRRSQSRRDDLEALGHVFLYFVRGSLPWQGIKAPQNDHRHDQMCEKKQATSIEDLCRGFPPEFAEYMTYTRGLAFEADPDYDYLRGLFSKILDAQGAGDDGVYDWSKNAAKDEPTPASRPSDTSPVAITPPKSEAPLHPALPQTADTPGQPNKHDSLVEAGRPATPQHATHQANADVIPPGSPPGTKRGRSEFVSELRPPTRSRPKKSIRIFYDGEAQRALLTLYRDVMAKRYAFHRAVKQSRAGISSGTAAAASAAAALLSRSNTTPGSYHRPMARGSAIGSSIISQSFSDTLDSTLSKVINELEEMSDRLLQNGDWSGAPRVQEWLKEVEDAVRKETQRLRLEMEEEKKRQEQRKAERLTASQGEGAHGGLQHDRPSSSPAVVEPTAYSVPSALRQASQQSSQQSSQRPGGRVPINFDQLIPPSVDDRATAPDGSPDVQGGSKSRYDLTSHETLEVDNAPDDEEIKLTETTLRALYGGGHGTAYAAGGVALRGQPSAAEPLSAAGPTATRSAEAPSAAVISTEPNTDLASRPFDAPLVPASAPPAPSAPLPTVEPSPAPAMEIAAAASPTGSPALSFPRTSPSAAVRSGMHELTIAADMGQPMEADDDITVDDGDDVDDAGEVMELVYRTASGTRKVMHVSRHG